MAEALTGTQAHIAYNILVLYAGADPGLRPEFVRYVTETRMLHEFRFQGVLGFGGKFYMNAGGCYISCYEQDAGLKEWDIIAQCNNLLKLLFES